MVVYFAANLCRNVDEDIVTVFVVASAVKEGNMFIIEGEEYPL
jgi:hypothetical protein